MSGTDAANAEMNRLREDAERKRNWKRWGAYLSERQWGTVREDYSPDGSCWEYYYPDSTRTHSYMRGLYRYPQEAFPYAWLVEENARRGSDRPEFEILDTGVFNDCRYFDVYIEYAKASDNDILIRITVHNRSDREWLLHLLPTLWFRNTWICRCKHEDCTTKPNIGQIDASTLLAEHETLGRFLYAIGPDPVGHPPKVLFTENETNTQRLFRVASYTPYVKDAFHEYFHAETGQGLGASHQTGRTSLIIRCLEDVARKRRL